MLHRDSLHPANWRKAVVKTIDAALARYKREVRKYKRTWVNFLNTMPEAKEVFVPRGVYLAFQGDRVRLAAMAKVLGLTKREVDQIFQELGVKMTMLATQVNK